MESFIADIVIALLKPLFGWYARRKASKQYAEEQASRDAALRDSQVIRDTSDKAIEASHVQTEQQLDHLRADAAAGGNDSLRRESDDVNAAMDAANSGVRRT
jgi:hypothetical protein